MTQLVAPYMIQQRGGTIVNIGSSSGYVYLPQVGSRAAQTHLRHVGRHEGCPLT